MSTWATQRRIKQSTRIEVFERDGYTCQLQYPGVCVGRAIEIDHVLGVAEIGNDHPLLDDPSNLRATCVPCHRRRSLQQQRAGIAKSNARRAARRKLPSANAPHPGEW